MNAMRCGRLPELVFLAGMMVLLMPLGDAHAEMWCIRDFGSDRPVCIFATARDCTSAAVIRGGICERESLVSRKPAPRIR
ncbi:MAG: hypothetical protein ACJAVZ_000618 [Afipia broomeae]|jgi:hypothetical protein|nr:MAG: hypothetical protein EKK35_16190 [Bradyrhizobiaceae bacterium]